MWIWFMPLWEEIQRKVKAICLGLCRWQSRLWLQWVLTAAESHIPLLSNSFMDVAAVVSWLCITEALMLSKQMLAHWLALPLCHQMCLKTCICIQLYSPSWNESVEVASMAWDAYFNVTRMQPGCDLHFCSPLCGTLL